MNCFMQTKFKRGQEVRILSDADPEFVEYNEAEGFDKIPIENGMSGKINILLPDGKYHVAVLDKKKRVIAYAPFEEDSLEEI